MSHLEQSAAARAHQLNHVPTERIGDSWATGKQRWMIAGLLLDPKTREFDSLRERIRAQYVGSMNYEKTLAEHLTTLTRSGASQIITALLARDAEDAERLLRAHYRMDL